LSNKDEMSSTTEDFARKVVEHSVDGLLVIDGEGMVCFANPAANALFAHRTKKLLGFHLGSPAIHEPVELILPGVGVSRQVEMRSVEIVWEGREATLAGLRDITAHKRAEEGMQKSIADLAERNETLMRFNRAAVGRELRMIELKHEVNELCRRLGEPKRYRIPTDEKAESA
jgi:nitrogen-specific signal transduction histidine kinase